MTELESPELLTHSLARVLLTLETDKAISISRIKQSLQSNYSTIYNQIGILENHDLAVEVHRGDSRKRGRQSRDYRLTPRGVRRQRALKIYLDQNDGEPIIPEGVRQ